MEMKRSEGAKLLAVVEEELRAFEAIAAFLAERWKTASDGAIEFYRFNKIHTYFFGSNSQFLWRF